ncbi:MAG: GNAT family N-acetyltransferase, partial [Alphaproteobacteria bacterium]|nr:GNAT family N-acetyltransferase [Alphaproteobacteria bacterium]
IFIWDRSIRQVEHQLLGLFILDLPASGRGTIARLWQKNYSALGAPLVDKTRAELVLDRFFKWVERHYPHIVAVQIPMLPAESNTALAFEAYSQHKGLEHKPLAQFQRAILSAGRTYEEVLPLASKTKHIRNWNRQSRQLEELGNVTYEIATTPSDIRQSMEDFMQLEASGWKGDQRTALIAKASLATFTRSMARLLAREGQIAIHALKLNGKPIAMGIVLISEDQACFWKIAYDEDFAAYSPGIQFVLAFSKHQTAQADIAHTDSCAIPNHPMIDRLWPERQNMVDLMIALAPRHNRAFTRAYARAIMVQSMREIAKKAYYRLMGRKVS